MQKRALAQPFKSTIKVMAHGAKRLAELLADFLQVQSFETKAFYGPALHVGQFRKGTLQMLPA